MERFDGDGAVRLLWEAKSRGIITSLDVTMDRTGRWNSLLEPYYPYLDYFMPSIEQAVEITKRERFDEMADFLLERGVKNVIIKAGSDGAFFKNAQEAFSAAATRFPWQTPRGRETRLLQAIWPPCSGDSPPSRAWSSPRPARRR